MMWIFFFSIFDYINYFFFFFFFFQAEDGIRDLYVTGVQTCALPIYTQEHSGPKGAFPPFQKDTFASQLVWLAITFVVLYLLISRIAVPRIGGIIEDRAKRIEGDFTEAQRLKAESEAALAAYEKALADARGRAQGIANETRDKLNAEAEARRKAIESELNAKLAEAEKTIAATRAAAMTNVGGSARGAS